MAKKASRRMGGDAGLTITSMMDMMTIILVFLLKSFSTEDIGVKPSDDLQLPLSSSEKMPKLAVNVVVSKRQILVDGEVVVSLGTKLDEQTNQEVPAVPEEEVRGQMISSLYERLLEKAETAKDLGARAGEEHDFKGQLLLQCDKTLPFDVIRKVMYTAGQAQFGEFRFVVIKQGE
jgi:biopolymer transport protein ExbD